MSTLRLRPDIEAALTHPKAPLAPELLGLWESSSAATRLRVMRWWVVIIALIYAGMAWSDGLSGPAAAQLGLVLRIGVNLPLAAAVLAALPHGSERRRAAMFGLYNVVLVAAMGVQSHFATPAHIDQYALGGGLLIAASTLLVPVSLRRAAIACAVAVTLFVALSLAPFGPNQDQPLDVVLLLALVSLATLRSRYRIQQAERQAFLLRLQDGLNTQDVVFANRILLDLSNTDPLTRVANRRCFDDRLAAWWPAEGRLAGTLGLLMIDVDHFKAYNDHYGHPAGDGTLQAVAKALALALELRPGQDTLARYGGEEFAALLPGSALPDLCRVGERLCRAVALLGIPHAGRTDGLAVVTISVGAVSSGEPGAAPETLVKAADSALYRAKREGRNRLCAGEAAGAPDSAAAPAGLVLLARSASISDDLRRAMLGDSLFLNYQPFCDCRTGAPTGCEALLRWRHREHGDIAPADFIPAAEESGAIVAIGKWVLRQACAEAAGWPEAQTLAVNVSPVQFSDPSLVATVRDILAESGLAPGRLLLEITEGLPLAASPAVTGTIRGLRALGVRIALDDFGTGYANFGRLQDMVFDVVKLDRSFLAPLRGSSDPATVIRPLVAFARAFGPAIVMEGIETQEQWALMQAIGCDWVQGFYFSPPLAAEAVRPVLRARRLPMAAGAWSLAPT